MDSLTSTYFSTSPQNSHQPLSSNPEEWIAHLVLSQTTDPTEWKQSKRVLKDYAKGGKLSEEQKKKVLSILSQKGFHTYTDDPRFRGLPVCPTKLLLFSPKLYEILFYPEQYPTESACLNTLSHEAFQIIIDTFDEEKLNNIPIELLAEITYVITLLPIPELEQICKNSLNQQITRPLLNSLITPLLASALKPIQIKTFYLLATIWPADQAHLFSELLEISLWAVLDCPVPDSSEAVAKEFEFFKQVMTETQEKGWEELSPLELYRLFLLIQEELKISPTLCSLRLKIFDKLLNYLKSGELNAKHCQWLIAEAQRSFDLCQRLKKDQLTIELKNINIPISLWPLFSKSNFFQSLITFHTKYEISLKQEISLKSLEDPTEKSFWLLLNFWMKDEEIDVNSLSVEQLIDLLRAADYLHLNDFDKTRIQIENAIIEQCDDTQESITTLAQLGCYIYCPGLKNHVISWLNRFSSLSIREIQEDRKNILKIEIQHLPYLEHLQSVLEVLKVILSNPSIKIEFLQNTVKPWENSLHPLIHLHCCIELGLMQEQKLLETQILKLEHLEDVSKIKDLNEWENFRSWGPYDFLTLLSKLPDHVSSHLLTLDEFYYGNRDSSPFWKSVRLCARVDTHALQKEMTRFREMALEPQKIFELSAEELPRFLFFFPQVIREFNLEKSIIFSTLLSDFSRMISKYIKGKSLSTDTLAQIIKRVQEFYPQEGLFIKDLKFIIFDPLQLKIHLLSLLNNKLDLELLSDEKIGEIFDGIPCSSIEWAFEIIFSDSQIFENPIKFKKMLKSLPAAHLNALQRLQKSGLDINHKAERFANRLSSMVRSLSLETRYAAASWAAATKNYTLMDNLLDCYKNTFIFETPCFVRIYTLSSLQAEPLEMLKAAGTAIKHLKIEINSNFTGLNHSLRWEEIVEACPHVEKLQLEITGAINTLDAFPLRQFSKLRDLGLWAHDSEAWKSLCLLKIPATIEHICLQEIHVNQIEEISNYGFFSHLPRKITLTLIDDFPRKTSWWRYFSLAADPLAKLFNHLSHCTELRIHVARNVLLPLKHLITYNYRLESLFLNYFDTYNTYPTIDDLQMLKEGLRQLKEFHIEFPPMFPSKLANFRQFLQEWQKESGYSINTSLKMDTSLLTNENYRYQFNFFSYLET